MILTSKQKNYRYKKYEKASKIILLLENFNDIISIAFVGLLHIYFRVSYH